jgi:hypothetical protein
MYAFTNGIYCPRNGISWSCPKLRESDAIYACDSIQPTILSRRYSSSPAFVTPRGIAPSSITRALFSRRSEPTECTATITSLGKMPDARRDAKTRSSESIIQHIHNHHPRARMLASYGRRWRAHAPQWEGCGGAIRDKTNLGIIAGWVCVSHK